MSDSSGIPTSVGEATSKKETAIFRARCSNLTALMREWRHSTNVRNQQVEGRLFATIYNDLENIARGQCRSRVLEPSDLVQDLFVKWRKALIKTTWKSRTHFFATAKRAIRNLAIDNYRSMANPKSALKVVLTDQVPVEPFADYDVIDDILEQIGREKPNYKKILELKYKDGLTDDEIALAMDISEATAHRYLRAAKTVLINSLEKRSQSMSPGR